MCTGLCSRVNIFSEYSVKKERIENPKQVTETHGRKGVTISAHMNQSIVSTPQQTIPAVSRDKITEPMDIDDNWDSVV